MQMNEPRGLPALEHASPGKRCPAWAVGDPRLARVVAAVRTAIVRSSDRRPFQELLIQLLARPGRVLAAQGIAKWPAFVLETCGALGGQLEPSIAAAAAVEFVMAATDVIDDLVDDEWPDQLAPPARAVNAILALTSLSQRCVSDTAAQLGAERALLVGDIMARGTLAAAAGEDLDLLLETTNEVSEELAHDMTRRKAGSLVAMACQVGAAVATDDARVLELVGSFGTHVGIVAQLLNDLAGIDPDSPRRGTDIQRRKKTLPVAYALCCERDEKHDVLGTWYASRAQLSERDELQVRLQIRSLGAAHYGWVVAEAHRRQALAVLRTLSRASGHQSVARLRALVPVVGARRPRRRPG
jgi:geranylgeranyl pyrophosphate synthase